MPRNASVSRNPAARQVDALHPCYGRRSRCRVSLAIETLAHWRSGLRPDASGYAAMVYLAAALQLELVVALVVMSLLYARSPRSPAASMACRRVSFDSFGPAVALQRGAGLLGLLLVHGFPRLVG